jgi:hypothetical protein
MLLAGAADGDTLAAKRALQSAEDVLALHEQPADIPQEAWAAVHTCWGHWQALYQSLSGYMVQLLQSTWKAHVPPLLSSLQKLLPYSRKIPSSLSLILPHTKHLLSITASKATQAAGAPREHQSSSPETTNWLCVLCERALQHPNASAQRFLASCVLAMASESQMPGGLFPDEWLTTVLAEALFEWTLTGNALEYAAAVCPFLCRFIVVDVAGFWVATDKRSD